MYAWVRVVCGRMVRVEDPESGRGGERELIHEPLLSGMVGGTDVPVACCCALCASIELSASSKLLVLLDRDPVILLWFRVIIVLQQRPFVRTTR